MPSLGDGKFAGVIRKRSQSLAPRGVTGPRARRGRRYTLTRNRRTALLALCLLTESARMVVGVGRDLHGRVACGMGRTALSDLLSRLSAPMASGSW